MFTFADKKPSETYHAGATADRHQPLNGHSEWLLMESCLKQFFDCCHRRRRVVALGDYGDGIAKAGIQQDHAQRTLRVRLGAFATHRDGAVKTIRCLRQHHCWAQMQPYRRCDD
jgi:hypothetical protein